jgi:hypothetical protein
VRRGVLVIGTALLALSACQSTSQNVIHVDGRVTLGPLCPVEREGSPCATPPGAFDGGEAVATASSGEVRAPLRADGTFVLDLPQGRWQVSATVGMSCSQVAVSGSGPVVIVCDTGIR